MVCTPGSISSLIKLWHKATSIFSLLLFPSLLFQILKTPYQTDRHTFSGEGPYNDPVLKVLMGRMGYSIPAGTHNLVHTRKVVDGEEDTLAAALLLLLASEKQ